MASTVQWLQQQHCLRKALVWQRRLRQRLKPAASKLCKTARFQSVQAQQQQQQQGMELPMRALLLQQVQGLQAGTAQQLQQ
jgi:hypothetical protein